MNKKFCLQEFVEWVYINEKDYGKYLKLADGLEDFLQKKVLIASKTVDLVLNNYEIVLGKCDEITYDEPGVVIAYTIIHFLERYRRFQITILELMRTHMLSFFDIYKVLDIGTGPSPALFAFSDIHFMMKEFIEKDNANYTAILDYSPDYVEMSEAFRSWLHHFTEHLLVKNEYISYPVPFHHGSFRDFGKINFKRDYDYCSINGLQWTEKRRKPKKYRYNTIFYSNFLTSADMVNRLEDSIVETGKWSLNKACIIVVGAVKENSNKYAETYKAIDRIYDNRCYNNYKFTSYTNLKPIDQDKFVFSYSDKYGFRLKEFHQKVYKLFEKYVDVSDYRIADKLINDVIDPSYSRENRWEVRIYKKKSKLRYRKY